MSDIPLQAVALKSSTKAELLAMLPELGGAKAVSPKAKHGVVYSAVRRLYAEKKASNLGVDPSVVHSLIDPLEPNPVNKRGLRRPE